MWTQQTIKAIMLYADLSLSPDKWLNLPAVLDTLLISCSLQVHPYYSDGWTVENLCQLSPKETPLSSCPWVCGGIGCDGDGQTGAPVARGRWRSGCDVPPGLPAHRLTVIPWRKVNCFWELWQMWKKLLVQQINIPFLFEPCRWQESRQVFQQ